MSEQIFISYRRDGGDVYAKLICEALKNKGYTVFYDFDSLQGGYFDERILRAIEGCTDFVLVLPAGSLDRCQNEDDWVRLEIKHAIKHGKNIIPVMLPGFSFPKDLPEDIASISRINGVQFFMPYFEAVMAAITDRLISKPLSQTQETANVILTKNTVTYDDGVYEGEFNAQGEKHGYGVYKYNSGDVYDGEWEHDEYNGHGVYKWADGDVYDGEYKDDKKNGHGVYKFDDGGVYDGEWKDDERNGHGVYKFADGSVYDGEWKDDKENGHGVCRFTDGAIYDGEYRDGDGSGYGVFKFANGNVYEGEFKDGRLNGHGVMKYANGDVYDGEWKDNKSNGHGVCRFTYGAIYDGEWKNHRPDGYGVLKSVNGDVIFDGMWKDGKPIT